MRLRWSRGSVLLPAAIVAVTVRPIPDAVDTVVCAPDDG